VPKINIYVKLFKYKNIIFVNNIIFDMLNIAPIIGTIFYLYLSKMLKNSYCNLNNKIAKSKSLYYFTIIHNMTLTTFSFYTFISLCGIVFNQGILSGHVIFMSQPYIKNLIFWFYISKYYEYFDTFLLYLKGRNPIFLQKYHHIGAVICWHLCYIHDVDIIIYGSLLNSGVHSIMYFYYLLTLFKINIRGMRMYITTLQILQLIVGGISGLYYYYPPTETKYNYGIIIFFNLYIAGLVYLFGEFMFLNYFYKKIDR
jgi:hypothetical protein